ncbi:MAG: hypothetical protein AAGC69_13660 [Paracraurococcus sp.]
MADRPFTRADLELLRRWDTPTICNAMEIVMPARRGRGFTLQPFVCADASLPPICGLARTGQIRAAAPSGRSKEQDRAARIGPCRVLVGSSRRGGSSRSPRCTCVPRWPRLRPRS